MAWSQDEERMLAMIERQLSDEDPRLAARLDSFNARVQRRERGRRRADRHGDRYSDRRGERRRRWPRRSTVVIIVSWLLIATLVATLLIMAFRHDAAALGV
jgi:preprotein translocase subunit Sec63